MLLRKDYNCPYRNTPHQNLAYAEYSNGHWCYSCGRGEFNHPHSEFSYKMTPNKSIGRFVSSDEICCIKDFPIDVLGWLYKYYVFDDLVYKYGLTTAYNELYKHSILVLPVRTDDGTIVAYQKRYFTPEKRFISKEIQNHIFLCGHYDTDTVVLVEDYISAIRVGEIENCICLFGLHMNKNMLEYVTNNFSNIKIWLDNDAPGNYSAAKIIDKLRSKFQSKLKERAFAIREPRIITKITTEYDPKVYSNSEIEVYLRGYT